MDGTADSSGLHVNLGLVGMSRTPYTRTPAPSPPSELSAPARSSRQMTEGVGAR